MPVCSVLPRPSPKLARALFLNQPRDKSREALIERSIKMYSLIRSPGDEGMDDLRAKMSEAFDRSHYPQGVRRQLAAIISREVSITWNLTDDEPQLRTRIFISVLQSGDRRAPAQYERRWWRRFARRRRTARGSSRRSWWPIRSTTGRRPSCTGHSRGRRAI